MRPISIFLAAVLVLIINYELNALTFKSDGSVVQANGRVDVESFADRFRNEMRKPTKDWAKSTGNPRRFQGYFGDDVLLPGAPLLRIQGIKKGEEYLDAVFRLNGFENKKALYRYIIANASPSFIEEMGLSENDAQVYLDTGVAHLTSNETSENSALAAALQGVQDVALTVGGNIEETISDQISEAIDTQLEDAVSDAVEEAIDNWLEQLIDYYNINPASILEVGDGWVLVDCNKTQC